jgi:hypothetical protein
LSNDTPNGAQRQHRNRRREADSLRPRGDLGEYEIGAGEHAQRREMMLADPCRIEPDLFGINCLVEDVGDEPVRVARIVVVVVVAEREIAKVHISLPYRAVK